MQKKIWKTNLSVPKISRKQWNTPSILPLTANGESISVSSQKQVAYSTNARRISAVTHARGAPSRWKLLQMYLNVSTVLLFQHVSKQINRSVGEALTRRSSVAKCMSWYPGRSLMILRPSRTRAVASNNRVACSHSWFQITWTIKYLFESQLI